MSFAVADAKYEGFELIKGKWRLVYGGNSSKPYQQWRGSSVFTPGSNDYDGGAPPSAKVEPGGSFDSRQGSSPVAYASSHRFVLCDAAVRDRTLRKADWRAAFLHAERLNPETRQFMWPPKGMSRKDEEGFALLFECIANIYGMKTAA